MFRRRSGISKQHPWHRAVLDGVSVRRRFTESSFRFWGSATSRRLGRGTVLSQLEVDRLCSGVDGTAEFGRVEVWRSGCRLNISVAAPFVWRCLTGSTLAPFPHPAHRTGHADLPHPALGANLTPSPTTRRAHAGSDVPARSARRGARVDTSRLGVA